MKKKKRENKTRRRDKVRHLHEEVDFRDFLSLIFSGFFSTSEQFEEEEALSEHFPAPRRFIHRICTHGYFDLAIAAIIGLNVVCMALEHYEQPKGLGDFLQCANYVFTSIFILEAVLKIYALGVKIYFRDRLVSY
jgi:hypothetical protein